ATRPRSRTRERSHPPARLTFSSPWSRRYARRPSAESGKGPRRCSFPRAHVTLGPPRRDLRAAVEVELRQDVRHVVIHGAFRAAEPIRDVAVAEARGYELRDGGLRARDPAARPAPVIGSSRKAQL